MPNRRTSPDVREKSSMNRRRGCCCVSLLYERNRGREKHSLQLEEMISSISSSLIGNVTGALLRIYPYKLRSFHPKQVSSTGKQTELAVIHTESDVPGAVSLRYRWKMAIRRLDYFFETVSQCFLDHWNELFRNRSALCGYNSRFCFP